MRRVSLLFATVLLAACVSESSEESVVGKSASKVINGVVDTPEKYPSTILIQTELASGYGAGCTATLITPHVAITARHCVSEYNRSSGFGADYAPSKMYIWYGAEPRGANDNMVARIVHNGASTIDNNDFAIIVLKDAATIPFAQIRLAKPPVKGETVAVAGYGVTQTDTPTTLGAGLHARYRRDNLRISYVGPIPSYYLGSREIVLGESICQGDSGGPVYAQGSVALLAVTSRGGNGQREDPARPWAGCVGTSAVNYFTRVDGFTDMIKKTVSEVGEIIWEEGEPKPTQPTTKMPDPGALGAVCAGPTDCGSKLCVEYDGKKVCSQACSESNACPAGFECAGGYCVAQGEAPVEPPVEQPGEEPAPAADPGAVTEKKGACTYGSGASDSSFALMIGLGLALTATRRRAR
jgi:V8-like Glu-specific endopeptidase